MCQPISSLQNNRPNVDPNEVRAPYNTMVDDLKFNVPRTAKKAMRGNPSLPSWAVFNSFDPKLAEEQILKLQLDETRQKNMQQIFGMISLIDYNIGRLLDHLDNSGLRRNTIVVFTSDHGDMMYEHNRNNKGLPYQGSAQVPMIVRWSGKIRKRRKIQTAYTSVDFVPTILSLMGVKTDTAHHGIDGSGELLLKQLITSNDDQIRFMTDGLKKSWAAAFNTKYKLILSKDEPWLFDLSTDPDELHNQYRNPKYADIASTLQAALLDVMVDYNFVLKQKSYLPNAPVCWDSKNEIEGWDNHLCKDLTLPEYSPACAWDFVNATCPTVCKGCCEDSEGEVWLYGAMRSCDDMNTDERFCTQEPAVQFCPKSCGMCD